MVRETTLRSVIKASSYRLTGTLATGSLVLLLTRRVEIAFAAAGGELITKLGLYFLHERVWNRISFGRRELKPQVIWLTGLSGAGKTTLSKRIVERLRAKGLKVEHLDGDNIRALFPNVGFTREERDNHIRRVALLAKYLEQHGVFVVTSLISPYRDSRRFAREICGNFVEVYLSTPIEECERRDPKGLYARARRGELGNFTGIDDAYEAPVAPELAVDTSRLSEEQSTDAILDYVSRRMRENLN